MLCIVCFRFYAGAWEGDCGDEGCGGRKDVKQELETNLPEMFVSMAPINKQMTAMENFVLVYFVFYFMLKCDPIEETLVAHRKCVD